MTKAILVFFLLLQTFSKAHAQIDVQHYSYQLQLTDASDTLRGTASISLKFRSNTNRFALHLSGLRNGKGMRVLNVTGKAKTFSNTHAADRVTIASDAMFKKDSTYQFAITYAGVPSDGLIISKNKYNDRTFFADNWPDRAHHWIPCNDNPSDKATVEFLVTAPGHYKVISNGILVTEKILDNNQKLTHWKEAVSIPTKVMTLGVARFAVKQYADSSIVPVSAWVYPQDSVKGFYDYALAPGIIKFFSDYIGPYPFEKLANVQSKTIFGGLENASAIFYGENTITGDGSNEALIAHETAHQWFGNSATETGFAHLWLSEGFATYMTLLYLEHKYGRDTLVKSLQRNRDEIIQFSRQTSRPVVDSVSGFMELLNANSYQKGSWILHMLRQEVGDTVFQKIIRTYYDRYKGGNADTWAFEKVAEDVSGKDLKTFFQQWLYAPGLPDLDIAYFINDSSVQFSITQEQRKLFLVPLEIQAENENGKTSVKRIMINERKNNIEVNFNFNVSRILIDPNVNLLSSKKIFEAPKITNMD